ncbi:hypothetical protein ACHAXS_011341 [Conticribra weissflogii]
MTEGTENMGRNEGNESGAGRPPSPYIFRTVMDYESVDSLRAALAKPPYQVISSHANTISGGTDKSASSPGPITSANLPLCDWQVPHLDLSTSTPQSIEEEVKRLMMLKDYSILDSDQEEKFERITALASRIFEVPICLVSLVDIGRQWFMSNRGLGDVRETSRHVSFCAHAILSLQDVFVVPETHNDPRFKENGLVTGPPYIRFHAGAPLISPEGLKLGTFCIIDSKPRPDGLSLGDKQNLRELAAMVMDTMVTRKKEMERIRDEKTRIIACAAHDLLSPLTGVQLNLELLMTDESLKKKLDSNQTELMTTAVKCSEIIERICLQAIESFRGDLVSSKRKRIEDWNSNDQELVADKGLVNIAKLVENINQVVATYPKQVPLFIEVDENVPPEVISDDLKIFRSILNYLTNACKQTTSGTIRLRIYVRKASESATPLELEILPGALVAPKIDVLVVEVHDSGPGVELEKYPTLFTPVSDGLSSKVQHSKMSNSGLGLYSVATEITSLGGEYGVFPREDLANSNPDNDTSSEWLIENDSALNGSVFWFSIPLILPTSPAMKYDEKGNEAASLKRTLSKATFSLPPTVQNNSETMHTTPKEQRPKKRISIRRSDFNAEENADESSDSSRKLKANKILASLSSVDLKPDKSERQKRVLVVDDSLTIRKGLSRGFSRLGFEVDEAENGLQGLKKLKSMTYDLVLLDFLMPVMDGVEVAKKFRAWETLNRAWFHQYIVGISAHANGKDAEVGIKAGMDRFMGKPVPLKSLKDLAESKTVSEAGALLDAKHQESVNAIEMVDLLDEEKSSCSSSMSLSEKGLRQSCLIAKNNSDPALQSLQRLVEICGWRVVVVNNGDDALRMLKLRNFGMVLIDAALPVSADSGSAHSGCSVVARFREWEQRSRVVRQKNILLLSDTYRAKSNSIPLGCDGVVEKPPDPSKISSILENASKETFKGNRDILLR